MDDFEHQYTIKDLAQFMRSAKENEDQKPFIFITGAGCSVTAGIPLANKIVSELNEQFALELKPLSNEDRKDYGKCMGRLEISKRRKYLQEYIGKAKINWSHIALACLIKEGYIRRVLTFNFDNLLARSCGLLGQYPPTYDFTAANLNLHRLIDDPAIVHLHGQGHGFVQLNTDSETEEHAARLKEFVGHTLSESPTLFIGYSGKNDAFLPQIEEQFSDQHRLFWVDMADKVPEHLQHTLLTSRMAHYMSCENGSDLFLIQLAQELDCFPPTIFADPYQHLLNELNEIANYPMPKEEILEDKKENRSASFDTSTQDVLLGTKNKLEKVQQQDKEEETDFLQEYLQNDYEKIIRKLEGKNSLKFEQSLWLARAYFGLALRETSVEKQVSIYEKLINKFEENTEPGIQEQVAKALLNKGIALGTLEQPENEVKTYEELIAKFGARDELVLQEWVAKAFMYRGITLGKLEQLENAIKVYDELIAKFGARDELVLQEQVAKALLNKGIALGTLEQPENEVKTYEELIAKFGACDELVLEEWVAKALLNKGITLGTLEQPENEVKTYEELIAKFGTRDELVLEEWVAKALLNKGITLGTLEQPENGIKTYEELIAKFGARDELVLEEWVAKALLNKGVTLERLKQPENAIEAYNELTAKFGERNEVGLQEPLAIAFNKIGYSKLLVAKKQWQDADTAKDDLYKAAKDFSKALTKSSRNNHALILSNLAYSEFLLGNKADSEIHLRKALQQGGQLIYDKAVKDIAKYPIDMDNSFRDLLDNIWDKINK
ncbi:MAG: tetratricopeptide repeat protein [Psychrobacter alimentarius]